MHEARETVVVLVRPVGPVNVGLVCRACANFDVAGIRVVDPGCDLTSVETRQFATHAQHLLRSIATTSCVQDAIADCDWVVGSSAQRRKRGILDTFDVGQVGPHVRERGVRRLGLVFGCETNGLLAEELNLCHGVFRIPSSKQQPSLNLSHAVAVSLYALQHADPSQRRVVPRESLADHATIVRLAERAASVLQRAGYFRRLDRERFLPKLNRVVRRMWLTQHDATALEGMLAQWERFR